MRGKKISAGLNFTHSSRIVGGRKSNEFGMHVKVEITKQPRIYLVLQKKKINSAINACVFRIIITGNRGNKENVREIGNDQESQGILPNLLKNKTSWL